MGCSNNHSGNEIPGLKSLPPAQSGVARHRCAVCAFHLGEDRAWETIQALREQLDALGKAPSASSPSDRIAGIGSTVGKPIGRRVRPPAGVRIKGAIKGGAEVGVRVGSGAGHVDVGVCLQGGPRRTRFFLPAGSVMLAEDDQVQHGILVQSIEIVVTAHVQSDWILAMYCANRGRRSATSADKFRLGPVVASPSLRGLFRLLKDKRIPEDRAPLVQDAVWEITDGDGLRRKTRAELEELRA